MGHLIPCNVGRASCFHSKPDCLSIVRPIVQYVHGYLAAASRLIAFCTPPRLPASAAVAAVQRCAIPLAVDASPPILAISIRRSGVIDAKPRFAIPVFFAI